MSHIKDRIMYSKLQDVINYCSWKLNMILLFKKKEAYEVATGEESKLAQSAYLKKLTKMQYKDRLIADHAAAWTATQAASLTGSMTVIPQSGESIIIIRAPASQSFSEPPILTQDNIKNLYQSHKKEWEEYHK